MSKPQTQRRRSKSYPLYLKAIEARLETPLRAAMTEHKLTATGLVDPENAKKLGMFAGVDALVLGTMVSRVGNTMNVTAKIITVDTAEIVGAVRAEFKSDAEVQKLVS